MVQDSDLTITLHLDIEPEVTLDLVEATVRVYLPESTFIRDIEFPNIKLSQLIEDELTEMRGDGGIFGYAEKEDFDLAELKKVRYLLENLIAEIENTKENT